MAEREQVRRGAGRTQETTEDEDAQSVDAERGAELKGELDGLLDEIDEVLESNAEEFVQNYVQKGGE